MNWLLAIGGWMVAAAGWIVAAAALLRVRRRLALVADAEHELRGAATVFGLAFERMPRSRYGELLALQLHRLQAALVDLARARGERPGADSRELGAARRAQLIGNLIDNAAEHGAGPVRVVKTPLPGGVRLEIRNPNRPPGPRAVPVRSAVASGRGLAIAARAARQIGGTLRVEGDDRETVATVDLPGPDLRRAA